MKEIVLVPTYHRPEFLFYCLTLIRAFDEEIPVAVFPDRGTAFDPDIKVATESFPNVQVVYVPDHDYHGNSFNTMEAYRWAYNSGAELIYYIEDDVFIHQDFFSWHREMHEEYDDIFASMGWVFNRHAPITNDLLFQPWYYSVGCCFTRKKLELIARHASPLYYEDMPGYISEKFKESKINSPFGIEHYEQDGLIQRIVDADKSQTVTCGMAKCSHLGNYGYNRGWSTAEELFNGCISFEDRVQRISDFLGDPYWRAEVFGREIVEREIGRVLPKRSFKYKMTVGEFESEFVSELSLGTLPRRINSVPVTPDTKFVVQS